MKASELIKELQNKIAQHGDLDCYVMIGHAPTTLDNIGYTKLDDTCGVEVTDVDKYGEEIYTTYQKIDKTVFKVL